MSDECSHYWIPNDGRGGEPEYMGKAQEMRATCAVCGAREWFSEEKWRAIPAAKGPVKVER